MVEYNNITISNYNDFVNELTIICNNYNVRYTIEKNNSNTFNLYIEDLKTIAGEYMMQDIMNLLCTYVYNM
jgi:hypothetical protein